MNERMNIPSGGPPEGVGSWGSDKERTKMHTPLEGLRRGVGSWGGGIRNERIYTPLWRASGGFVFSFCTSFTTVL